MADARHRIWHRVGPAAVAMSALLVGAAAPGCGDSNETTTTTGTTTSEGGGGSDTGGGGAGGTNTGGGGTGGTNTGGTTSVGGGGSGPDVAQAAQAKAFDSTPDASGDFIYFTGITTDADSGEIAKPGVFKVVPLTGIVTEIFAGDPVSGPFGIAIDEADKALYVADTAFDNVADAEDSPRGAILKFGVDPGSPPAPLAGSAGFRPRGVDVIKEIEGDTVYFTGIDPVSGEPGVFQMLAAGGGATTIVKGAPLVDPSGIAVGKDRTFVTDTLGADSKLASVFVIENGTATTFVADVGVGYPAGIALSMDEKTVYVSGIDPITGFDVVLVVDVASKAVTPFAMGGIETNVDAGGLHRARKTDIFSWCDSTAGGTGAVYKITFK